MESTTRRENFVGQSLSSVYTYAEGQQISVEAVYELGKTWRLPVGEYFSMQRATLIVDENSTVVDVHFA